MKFCTYCGAQLLSDAAKFCNKCGARTVPIQPPPAQPSTWSEPPAPAPQQEQQASWPSTASATMERESPPATTEEAASKQVPQEDAPKEIPMPNPFAKAAEEDFAQAQQVPLYQDHTEEMPIQPLEDFSQAASDPYLQQSLQEEVSEQEQESFGANIPYVHAEVVGEQLEYGATPFVNLSESKDKPSKSAKNKQPKPPKPRKQKKQSKLLPALLLTFLAFVLVGGGIFGFILYNNSPQAAVKAFVKALQTKDTQYLVENTAVRGEPLTKEQARTLCKAFEDASSIEELSAHLLDEVNEDYDSFSMGSIGKTLKSYQVSIRPAVIEIEKNTEELTLLADGVPVELKATKSGAWSASLLPGKYTLVGSYVANGVKGETEPQEVFLYSTTIPVEVDMTADVPKRDPAPAPVPVPPNPVEEDVLPEEETPVQGDDNLVVQLADTYYEYYTSFLQAINEWDTSYLRHVHDNFWNTLVKRIETENQNYLFEFVDMSIDKNSIKQYTEDGKDTVSMNVRLAYRYTYRDNTSKWYDGGNFQNIYFVFDDAQNAWMIANTEIRTKIDMSKDVIYYSDK